MIRNNEQNINIVCARGRQGWWDENGKSNLIRNYQDYCQGKYADWGEGLFEKLTCGERCKLVGSLQQYPNNVGQLVVTAEEVSL